MPCVVYGRSFLCVGLRFRAWATVFVWAVVLVHGPLFSCVGDRFHAWATVFVWGRPSSCGGNRLHAWATVFVHGARFHAWALVSVRGRSFPCVGSRLDAWVVVGIGGVVVSRGVVVLWFSWDNSGRVGSAYRVEEQRQTTNFHLSFVVRLPRHG